MTRPGWPSPKATGAPRSRPRTARPAPRSAHAWGRRAGRTAAPSPRDGRGRTGSLGRWMSRPRRLPGSEEVEPHPDEGRVVPRWSARRNRPCRGSEKWVVAGLDTLPRTAGPYDTRVVDERDLEII